MDYLPLTTTATTRARETTETNANPPGKLIGKSRKERQRMRRCECAVRENEERRKE
jgi:hypothetical protein